MGPHTPAPGGYCGFTMGSGYAFLPPRQYCTHEGSEDSKHRYVGAWGRRRACVHAWMHVSAVPCHATLARTSLVLYGMP